MPNTYTLLETVTVGAAGASSVTFNSIPQTGYTDLVIKTSVRNASGSAFDGLRIAFNGSSSNYTLIWLGDAAGSPVSYTQAAFGNNHLFYITGDGATANTFANGEIYIPNYASANYKSLSADGANENNAASIYQGVSAGLWSITTAISSLTFTSGSNFKQHSTFSLYGVSALGTTPTKAPKATGGSIIQTDGTYWYHAFLSSGTFTPATALSCDVLVVAGGGSGGANYGGGGGAGGVSYQTGRSISTSSVTVTIGAGGASTNTTVGNVGSNSVFDTITSNGGGGGGYSNNVLATTGGSGGGGGGYGFITGAAATQGNTGGATGYGFAGGNGQILNFVGGGGGGAGSVGAAAASAVGGNGGTGFTTLSSWASATSTGVGGGYAGGGGGGSRNVDTTGSGTAVNGGSAGGRSAAAADATANTGGGGGGGGSGSGGTPASYPSGAGGSGIVIVRYLA